MMTAPEMMLGAATEEEGGREERKKERNEPPFVRLRALLGDGTERGEGDQEVNQEIFFLHTFLVTGGY